MSAKWAEGYGLNTLRRLKIQPGNCTGQRQERPRAARPGVTSAPGGPRGCKVTPGLPVFTPCIVPSRWVASERRPRPFPLGDLTSLRVPGLNCPCHPFLVLGVL